MKIVVRNVAGMPYPGNPYRNRLAQDAVWESLLATQPDVLVVQEASGLSGPFEAPDGYRADPFGGLPGNIGGSVIVVADHVDADLAWRPVHPLLDELKAWLDFAVLRMSDTEVRIVSVHASKWSETLWELAGRGGPIPTGETRPWPSDVILDVLVEQVAGSEAILAGDWNEAPNFPRDDDPYAAEFFGRARTAGFVEVVNDTFGGPVRTNFTRNAVRSYQNDHVFCSPGVAERVEQVAVFNEPKARRPWSEDLPLRLSDHAGIILTLRD